MPFKSKLMSLFLLLSRTNNRPNAIATGNCDCNVCTRRALQLKDNVLSIMFYKEPVHATPRRHLRCKGSDSKDDVIINVKSISPGEDLRV